MEDIERLNAYSDLKSNIEAHIETLTELKFACDKSAFESILRQAKFIVKDSTEIISLISKSKGV